MCLVQFECADKGRFQLRQEMQRASQESNMPTDWFSTCQTTDGLVDYRLENRGGKILLCGAFVDKRLNI